MELRDGLAALMTKETIQQDLWNKQSNHQPFPGKAFHPDHQHIEADQYLKACNAAVKLARSTGKAPWA